MPRKSLNTANMTLIWSALRALSISATLALALPAQTQDAVAKGDAATSSSFWYSSMDHTGDYRGVAPYTDNPDSYNVYVAVTAGDAGSLQDAINSAGDGDRHQQWLASQPRVVYIPPGTYELSNTLNMHTDTILMGDATDPPVIKAASGFSDDVLLNGQDPSTGVSGEISFAVGLKNLILDTTAVDAGSSLTALYWGVAQVAQLQKH